MIRIELRCVRNPLDVPVSLSDLRILVYLVIYDSCILRIPSLMGKTCCCWRTSESRVAFDACKSATSACASKARSISEHFRFVPWKGPNQYPS